MDALGLERAHLVGNSMGGRVALEIGLTEPRPRRPLVLLSPGARLAARAPWALAAAAAAARARAAPAGAAPVVEAIVRRLVPGADDGWAAAGVDEFLRAYLTPRGRAAFYAAARNIYLDEPHGDDGFWTRLETLEPDSLFVWGRQDTLVPIGFMPHVEQALPAAPHLELDCGHVPQLERPRETHAAIRDFMYGSMSFPPGSRLPRLVQAALPRSRPTPGCGGVASATATSSARTFPSSGAWSTWPTPRWSSRCSPATRHLPRRRGERDVLAGAGRASLLTLDEDRHLPRASCCCRPSTARDRRYPRVIAETTTREVSAGRWADLPATPAHRGHHARGDPAGGVRHPRRRRGPLPPPLPPLTRLSTPLTGCPSCSGGLGGFNPAPLRRARDAIDELMYAESRAARVAQPPGATTSCRSCSRPATRWRAGERHGAPRRGR